MANIGNPFSWDLKEERSFETLAQRGKATYSKPLDTINNKTSRDSFFSETFGVSPNRAFITGFTPFEPIPFLPLGGEQLDKKKDDCCDEKPTDGKASKTEKETHENNGTLTPTVSNSLETTEKGEESAPTDNVIAESNGATNVNKNETEPRRVSPSDYL